MSRSLFAFVSATALAACGARSGVDAAAGAASGEGAMGPGGDGGGGNGASGGSSPFVCPELEWAGEPVFIELPFGNTVVAPRLVATGEGDYGLVFDAITDSIGNTVGSFPIHQPFESWPPVLGVADLNFPSPGRFAISRGESAMFAFAASDGAGGLVLGQALPGQNGSSFVAFPSGAPGVHFLSRNGAGEYLGAQGSDDYLSAFGFSAFSPESAPVALGTLGCASQALASAVPAGGEFLVASAVDQPFDECLDPDLPGPPLHVQTHRLGVAGGVVQGTSIALDAPVVELALAGRAGGAWLGLRAAGQGQYEIRRLDDLTISEPVAFFVSGQTNARHALASSAATFAIAELVPNEIQPGGDLVVGIFHPESFVFITLSAVPLGVFPTDEPTIAASEDGRSILVAFPEVGGVGNSIALLRADCRDAIGP